MENVTLVYQKLIINLTQFEATIWSKYQTNVINIQEANWGYSFIDKKNNLKKNIINSRLETIRDKILFKDSYYNRKCLIPLNGYYEWKIEGKIKIPYFISIPLVECMYMAGIWKYIDFNKSDKKKFTIINFT